MKESVNGILVTFPSFLHYTDAKMCIFFVEESNNHNKYTNKWNNLLGLALEGRVGRVTRYADRVLMF